MTRDEIETCWKDHRNWKWGIYYCKTDPRVIVPKRLKWMGWTINFARPSAIPVLVLLLASLAGPVLIVASKGAGIGSVLVTALVMTIIMCVVCVYFSSRTE